ncbi:putative uncharacterized protein [Clostridium sp. CAG:149]|nr:putative uncharacterized protein [Clostridium sp. CAG:149]
MARRAIITSNIKYLKNPDEVNALIHSLKTSDPSSKFCLRNLAMFQVAIYCGLRASEVGMIRLSDYDPKDQTIYCRRLKGSVNNQLRIIDPKVSEVLNLYYDSRMEQRKCKLTYVGKSEYLFISKTGKPVDRRTLDRLMKFYCSFTPIDREKWHFHVLKHTRAMQLIETPGIDIRDVQWWLGHKNIANTMIYLNYSVNAQKQLYDKLINQIR